MTLPSLYSLEPHLMLYSYAGIQCVIMLYRHTVNALNATSEMHFATSLSPGGFHDRLTMLVIFHFCQTTTNGMECHLPKQYGKFHLSPNSLAIDSHASRVGCFISIGASSSHSAVQTSLMTLLAVARPTRNDLEMSR